MMKYNPNRLSAIDAVDIVSITGVIAEVVSQYMQEVDSTRRVQVTGELAQEIASLWRNLPLGEQMRCHIPHFGLRFYNKDELLVQGSICWECNNIYVNESGKDSFYEFDAQHQDSQKLLGICKQSFEKMEDGIK